MWSIVMEFVDGEPPQGLSSSRFGIDWTGTLRQDGDALGDVPDFEPESGAPAPVAIQ